MTFDLLGWIQVVIEFLHFPEILWAAQSEAGRVSHSWPRNTRWRKAAGCVWRRGYLSLFNRWRLRGFDTRAKKRATVTVHSGGSIRSHSHSSLPHFLLNSLFLYPFHLLSWDNSCILLSLHLSFFPSQCPSSVLLFPFLLPSFFICFLSFTVSFSTS